MRASSRRALAAVAAWMLTVIVWVPAEPAPAAPGAGSRYRSDRILIQPKTGHSAEDLARFHAAAGIKVHRRFAAMGDLEVLTLPPRATPEDTVRAYRQSGLVAFAEPDFWVGLALVPNDPRFADGTLWHLHNTGQSGGVADADIDGPEGWDTLSGATNIIVALVDTGVRYAHEDLAANMWINPREIAGNGVDDDANGFVDDIHGINAAANTGDPWDASGHGTKVAGVLGAVGNNSRGVTGVAWRLRMMSCRFFDDEGNGSLSDAVECFDYARVNGARVINASFIATDYSSALYAAVSTCRGAGILVVAAAGNDAVNNDVTPYYPASFDLDNVLAVAATTRTDSLADYSNYGATSVDLAAPGSAIYSTAHTSDTAYAFDNGTSFAAPMVAGTVALLHARYPTDTYRQTIDRLLAATDPLPGLAGRCVTGARLNLARALGPSVVADFTATPPSGTPPLTVHFADTSYGSFTNWAWDFGDGTTSVDQHPVHTYEAIGRFAATLTVTSSQGLVRTTNRTIAVVANYTITNAPFNWVDPGAMTALSLDNDGVSAAQALPFAFDYYGQSYSQLYVGANGLLGFDPAGMTLAANTDLPNPAAPNNVICPFWDDLNPAAGGTVHLGTAGDPPHRQVVVSWVDVRYATFPPANYSFQVLLEETTHAIRFQYLSVSPGRGIGTEGRSATVGVEHADGTVAARYACNGSTLLANSTALRFTAPLPPLAVEPSNGFAARGHVGGPFVPASQTYTLTNRGPATLAWSARHTTSWLALSRENGELAGGGAVTVTVALTGAAALLGTNVYEDVITFANLTNPGNAIVRTVQLTVAPPPQLSGASLSAEGWFQFSLAGEPAGLYVIEMSPDLATWSILATNPASLDGLLRFLDPDSPAWPRRFYRARPWIP
ncbi:MAG: S8 family serine peptidase [Verrucomicrobia bacterium]|nr:S8 family serine peptidase [Verrucomicrobiota bacterium]